MQIIMDGIKAQNVTELAEKVSPSTRFHSFDIGHDVVSVMN